MHALTLTLFIVACIDFFFFFCKHLLFVQQSPAAGPEGEAVEGGGGGDEGNAELHRGGKSSCLGPQQECGK